MTSAVGNHGLRALMFDAGFTLLAPARPASETYYQIACDLGVELDPTTFAQHFHDVWREHHLARQEHSLGEWSEDRETDFWSRIASEIATPFPSLFERRREWLDEIRGYYDRADAWTVIDRADQVLSNLCSRGWRIAVVSNWHRGLRGILHALGLFDSCEFLLTSVEARCLKPHPGIFRQALVKLRLNPEQVMVVGDSWEEDVVGAHRAGLQALWISDRHRPDHEFKVERISRLSLLEARLGKPIVREG